MTFDYRKMVKEATETGQPVTRVRQLVCHDNIPASVAGKTIDTTAKVVPSHDHSQKPPFDTLDYARRWKLPSSHTLHTVSASKKDHPFEITPEKVAEIVQQMDRSGIPACMMDSQQADFYVSLVGYEFTSLNGWTKIRIIRAVGGNDADAKFWQSHPRLEDFLPWVVKKLNRSPVISALVLGKLMCLKPEFCFSAFPEATQQRAQYSKEAQVEDATPKSIVVGAINFKRLHMDIQRDLDDSIMQAVCHYSDGKNDVFALAVRVTGEQGKDSLKIGMKAAVAHLLSRDMIVRHHKASVLICVDIKVAISFRDAAREGHVFERTGVIVSGFAGGEETPKGLLLSDVAGHSVTIVSTPGQKGWDGVDLLVKRCLENGATDVNVYPWPIVQGGVPDISSYKPEMQNNVLAKTTNLDTLELPSQLVARIRREAIPIEDMASWKKNVLLLEKAPICIEGEQSCQTDFEIVTFEMLPDVVPREDDVPVAVRQMFTPQYTTLIWGASNAGKSWMGINLAISLTTGTPYLYFTASDPCNLCYLDGEVGSDFKPRVNQLLQGREDFLPLLNKNLFVISAKGGFNILGEETQKILMDKLQQSEVKCIVIDNLLSLAPTASKSNSTPLFDFIHRIEKLGIGVIVLHHAGKTGKDFKGPVDLASLCQNVIHLEGRDQLIKEINKDDEGDDQPLNQDLAEALEGDGPVVRMTIEKCKIAPELERRKMVYKLPVGGIWKFVEGDMPGLALDGSNEYPERAGDKQPAVNGNLTKNQQTVYAFFEHHPEKDIMNKDIQNLLGVKEGASRNALKDLERMGYIERLGKDNQTIYRLKK